MFVKGNWLWSQGNRPARLAPMAVSASGFNNKPFAGQAGGLKLYVLCPIMMKGKRGRIRLRGLILI